MTITSLALLYQEQNSLLTTAELKVKVLKNLCFFLQELVNALKSFYLKKEIDKFDPHVGETSCQIRAYINFLLFNKTNQPDFLSKLKKEIQGLEALYKLATKELKKLNLMENSKKKLSSTEELKNFLNRRNLVFLLSEETLFLMQSYFLTRFKEQTINGDSYINHDKISLEMAESRKFSKKIVHYYQSKVAKFSTNFIFGLLKAIPEYTGFEIILKSLNYNDDDGRSVLPCFITMKIMLKHMLVNNCPVLIKIKRLCQKEEYDDVHLLFEPDNTKQDYKLMHDLSNTLKIQAKLFDKPCVIIEGIVEYVHKNFVERKEFFVDRFKTVGIIKIILSNMANHPQFSGTRLAAYSYNPYLSLIQQIKDSVKSQANDNEIIKSNEFNKQINCIKLVESELINMKRYGKHLGCCEEKPSLFFIKHIYSDKIYNHRLAIVNKFNYNDILNKIPIYNIRYLTA